MVIAVEANPLLLLALLACPVGMGLMMWFMARGMRGGRNVEAGGDRSLPDLKAEQARLAAKVEALEEERAGERRQPAPSEEAREERVPTSRDQLQPGT